MKLLGRREESTATEVDTLDLLSLPFENVEFGSIVGLRTYARTHVTGLSSQGRCFPALIAPPIPHAVAKVCYSTRAHLLIGVFREVHTEPIMPDARYNHDHTLMRVHCRTEVDTTLTVRRKESDIDEGHEIYRNDCYAAARRSRTSTFCVARGLSFVF